MMLLGTFAGRSGVVPEGRDFFLVVVVAAVTVVRGRRREKLARTDTLPSLQFHNVGHLTEPLGKGIAGHVDCCRSRSDEGCVRFGSGGGRVGLDLGGLGVGDAGIFIATGFFTFIGTVFGRDADATEMTNSLGTKLSSLLPETPSINLMPLQEGWVWSTSVISTFGKPVERSGMTT